MVQAIDTVQEWIDAHGLQKLMPALEELGAEPGDGSSAWLRISKKKTQRHCERCCQK